MMKYMHIGVTCEAWLSSYEDHLTKVLGVALLTRTSYMLIASRLLTHIFANGNVDRSMLTPSAIIEFVTADAAPRKGRGPGKTMAGTSDRRNGPRSKCERHSLFLQRDQVCLYANRNNERYRIFWE